MKTHKLRPAVRPAVDNVYKEKAMTEINQALANVNKEVFNF